MTKAITAPTQAERDFTLHCFQEDTRHDDNGPAHKWANEHGIANATMIAFGYWEQRNNDRWFNQLLEDDPPAFRVPWSSAEEFFVRVRELLELNPQVRYLTMDLHSRESFSGVFEGTTTDVRQD